MFPLYMTVLNTFFLSFLLQASKSEPTTRIKIEENFHITNFKVHKDHKLTSASSLKNISVNKIVDCMMDCTANTQCVSANVHTARNPRGMFDCTLLAVDKYGNETNLTATNGVDHYTLPTKCDKAPCKHNGKCIPVYVTYDTYYCKCLPGTKGSKCEIPDFENCAQMITAEYRTSGVFPIKNPIAQNSSKIEVFCDMTTGGGGWTLIQRRKDGSVDFYRGWADYKQGFGDKNGEYWLGLDFIHAMTSHGGYRLRVDLESFEGETRYAEYDTFIVADEADNYRLTIDNYTGTAGDSMATEWHQNMQFTTKDRDNDIDPSHCAHKFLGAWWYSKCHMSNLNGQYLNGANNFMGQGVTWYTWKGQRYSHKKADMKIRPKTFA